MFAPTMPAIYEFLIVVDAIDDEIVRDHRERRLVAVAELDDVVVALEVREEFEQLQLVMMGEWRRRDRRPAVRRLDLRQQRRVARVDPGIVAGQPRSIAGRSDRHVRTSRFRRQDEIACERRASLEHDGVAWLRVVDRRLEIPASVHCDYATG